MEQNKNITPTEKIAIDSLKTGWGQLFHRAENGPPYGEFIGQRPYPTKFWQQVDIWCKGFDARQSIKDAAISELMIEKEALSNKLTQLKEENERLRNSVDAFEAWKLSYQNGVLLPLEQRNKQLEEALSMIKKATNNNAIRAIIIKAETSTK